MVCNNLLLNKALLDVAGILVIFYYFTMFCFMGNLLNDLVFARSCDYYEDWVVKFKNSMYVPCPRIICSQLGFPPFIYPVLVICTRL